MRATDEFPRELSLGEHRGKWVLHVHGVDLYGEAVSSQRWVVEAIAEAIARVWRERGGES